MDTTAPNSREATFQKAAKILLSEMDKYGLGFASAYTRPELDGKTHLWVCAKHRQVAFGEAEINALELDENPYVDTMTVLEALGARSEELQGGYQKGPTGEFELELGTMGKEGPGAQRMYTVCEHHIPIDQLDYNKALQIVRAAEAVEKLEPMARSIFKLEPSEQFFSLKFAQRKLTIELGKNFSTALERLETLRTVVGKVLTAEKSQLSVDDILPNIPEVNGEYHGVVIDFMQHPEAIEVLHAAFTQMGIDKTRGQEWRKEISYRNAGVDTLNQKISDILNSMGLKGAQVRRRHRELGYNIDLPADVVPEVLKKVEKIMGERLGEVPAEGSISAQYNMHMYCRGDSVGGDEEPRIMNVPIAQPSRRLTINFSKMSVPDDPMMDTMFGLTMEAPELVRMIGKLHENCCGASRAGGSSEPPPLPPRFRR